MGERQPVSMATHVSLAAEDICRQGGTELPRGGGSSVVVPIRACLEGDELRACGDQDRCFDRSAFVSKQKGVCREGDRDLPIDRSSFADRQTHLTPPGGADRARTMRPFVSTAR